MREWILPTLAVIAFVLAVVFGGASEPHITDSEPAMCMITVDVDPDGGTYLHTPTDTFNTDFYDRETVNLTAPPGTWVSAMDTGTSGFDREPIWNHSVTPGCETVAG